MYDVTYGSTITLTVAASSVGFSSANLKPTTGKFAGKFMEEAIIQAVGPLYVETGGDDADTNSFPMAAADVLVIKGHQNLVDLRLIRNTNSTSAVVIPGYM